MKKIKIYLILKKYKKKISLTIIIALTPLVFSGCYNSYPLEKLSIVTGILFDKDKDNPKKNLITSEILSYDENDKSIKPQYVNGSSLSIYEAFNKSHAEVSKSRVLGDELVYIITEAKAKDGIKDILDSFLRDDEKNERAFVGIGVKSTEEYNKLKPHAATLSEDFFNIFSFADEANFYCDKYEIVEVLKMYYQNGREIVLPLIDIKAQKPVLAGLALFNDDKLIYKANLEEARLINMIRNSGKTGYIHIVGDNDNEFIDFTAKNKVKIKVDKKDDTLIYNIKVGLNGILTLNTLENSSYNLKSSANIENAINKLVKKDLEDLVKKMQENFKCDILDLGKYALAKYGRDSGSDSVEHLENAKINITVDTTIIYPGRKTDIYEADNKY